ncbi:MAG TPA: sulfite exporter TauE/SafE family protein, partial [Candidatus Desulfobacillus denitrificans]|nr:sulfite exporter TauE/SafE family protein [Candidatus Desulfobacillus denitrificans]
MPDTGYIAVFLVGLLGGTHCMAMCGGIVGALSAGLPPGRSQWPLQLAYNFGRISDYALADAALGTVDQTGLLLEGALPVQI